MRPRLGATGAALVSVALVLAACGGDDADDVTEGPTVTFATQPSRPSDTVAPTTEVTTSEATGASSATTAVAGTSVPATAPASTAPLGDPVVTLVPVGPVFEQPVDLAVRTGDTTAYVVERVGRVTPLRDGEAGAPVLDITDLTEGEGERGLLGLTFSADGSLAYVNHTDDDGDTVVAEYAVAADGTFDPSSRRVLLTIDQPYANHNGGDVTIGPDGMLYIGMGDGGDANDPERRALNVSNLLGKLLRIDPTPSGDQPYTIPADNPFVGIDGARPEIWSVGLRNPWRFSFDPATGDLWVADVGQNQWEEIDAAWASDGAGRGLNFGWSAMEGTHRFNEDQPADGVTPPVWEYEHGDLGCSISGGAVYRGTEIPALAGWYVFGDYCSGRLAGLQVQDRTVVRDLTLGRLDQLVAVRQGPDGELWAISIGGQVTRIAAG
ncbi:MAG: PQQ-dependent sugar dehydrogenase [Acidimicrobiales bacterium]